MKRLFGSNTSALTAVPFVRRTRSSDVGNEENGQSRADHSALGVDVVHIVEGITVLVAAFAVSVVLTWPLVLGLGDHIFGPGGDSTGTIATLRLWATETGYSIFGTSHVSSFGAPFGYEQGNGVNLQSAFVFFPAYLITEVAGAVIAYNFVVLSGLALSGAAMYWLVRWLGCASLVAAWAGLVVIVFPWHLEKAQGHTSFVHLEGFPLLLLAVFAWYRKPDLRRVLLIGGAATILWTTSGYFGFMGLAALPPLFLLAVIFHARSVGLGRALRRIAFPIAASLAVPAVVYVIASRGATDEGIAPMRGVHELVFYGARPWEYLIPSYRNWLFGDEVDQWLFAHLHGSNFSETSLYVGWITIVLAAGWLLGALLRRSRLPSELRFLTLALAGTVVTGLLFSLPTPLPRTDIPTPARLIWEVAPQFRVPARFVALVMAGLVPLAALGLETIRLSVQKRFQARRPLALIASGAACLVAGVLSVLELTISPAATVTNLSAVPLEYSAVRQAPPGLLAEYPLAPPDQAINSDYLFWQGEHERRLVNGAPFGTFADGIRRTLVDPTTPGTAEALAALGASVVIMRPSVYAFTGGPPAETSVAAEGYRTLARTPTETAVWRVTAKPAPAIAGFASGFHPPETITPGSTMRWMATSGTVELYAAKPGLYKATFSLLSYARPRQIRIEGRGNSLVVQASPRSRTASLLLALPRGLSSLKLNAQPSAEGLPDGRQATVYLSNLRFTRVRQSELGAPVLPASETVTIGDR